MMQQQINHITHSITAYSQVGVGLAVLGLFLVMTFITIIALFTRGRVPRLGCVVFVAFIIVLLFAMWTSGYAIPPAIQSWFVH